MKALKYISAILFGAVLAGCSGDPVLPPLPEGPDFGLGTQESPFTATQVSGMNNPGTSAWVKGYIVGGYNYALGSSVQTDPANCQNSNILLAADPTETVFANCVAVQLPAGELRNALNLQNNPQNLGQEVAVYGSLEKYCGTAGVKNASAAIFNEQFLGKLPEPTPDTPVEGDGNGSADKPYSVDQTIALGNPESISWVEGIIVGTYKYDLGNGVQTDPANFDATNVLLAQNAGETEWNKCIAIQLPAGDLRNAINLVNNPGNMGKKLAIQGTLTKYCGLPGIKFPTAAKLDGVAIGSATPAPPAEDAIAYVAASSITSGSNYIFWTDNKVGLAMDSSKAYSWLTTADLTAQTDGSILASPSNAYTFTQEAKGWTIKSGNTYLYMEGTYNSFQLSTEFNADNDNYFWTVAIQADGRALITNVGNGKTIQYSSTYKSCGAYPDTQGVYPYLYQAK